MGEKQLLPSQREATHEETKFGHAGNLITKHDGLPFEQEMTFTSLSMMP